MKLRLEPTRIAAIDTEGLLVFSDFGLVAVLVRLSEMHGEETGQWFLEAGLRQVDRYHRLPFINLDAAQDWIKHRIAEPI